MVVDYALDGIAQKIVIAFGRRLAAGGQHHQQGLLNVIEPFGGNYRAQLGGAVAVMK